jgi:hypothetical protein
VASLISSQIEIIEKKANKKAEELMQEIRKEMLKNIQNVKLLL